MKFNNTHLFYCYFTLILIQIALSFKPASSVPQGALITSLPGFSGSLPSKHYAGYVTLDESHGKKLYYYFVESEGNPSKDPVVLWLNGGPGCSSFDGFVYEHGPFNFEAGKPHGSLPTLHLNPYSWSKVSSIIYLDSPAGVGLSYSGNVSDYETGDLKTAADSHTFLLKWFELYPEFLSNPFYISGESYAGVYVPTLAYEVAQGISAGIKPIINLKGYMVGNGVTDDHYDGNALVPFAHGMGLISDELYETVSAECQGNFYNPTSESCEDKLAKVDELLKDINIYDILEPCYHDTPSRIQLNTRVPPSFRRLGETERPLPVRKRMFGRAWPFRAPVRDGYVPTWPQILNSEEVPCTDDEVANAWLNNETVRKAIHAESASVAGNWELCTDRITFYHDAGSMIKYHKNLTTRGYRAIIFSGDHDMCVPYTGSQAWTRSVGYKTIDEWRPWYVKEQVAGYVQGYDNNLSFLTVKAAARHRRRIQWPVKQVTKSNFSEALAEIKACILNSDYVAVSFQKTGGHSAPWQKILPIDTEETAYFKAKQAAERFQILQFAVCPFSVKASKLIAHPYNFHLFPRDELKVGMPSYSFSCQSSYLTAMAQEGFDFNACIYNGISYLSKAQELAEHVQIGLLPPSSCTVQSSSVHSVADSLFTERIKSRVKNWISACKDSNKAEDALISSLRKLISGSEVYGSRPSLNIDVCSERQVKLALETLKEFVDVVPLQLPKKGAGVQAVRAVLTSSQEDKNLLEKELQDMEQERRERVLGFREVIDFISTSQRPVVVHNSLNDFASIHSKFLAPLPVTMDEFKSSLHLVFPHILDVSHLMKEIGPFEKMNNMPAAISYLERRFPGSIDMNISSQDTDKVNIHGHNVLRVCHLFVKLCSILKISPDVPEDGQSHLSSSLERHSNIFNPCSSNSRDPIEDDVRIWTGNSRTVSINNMVFLWGFESGISARSLKDLLCDSHDVFSEEFDVRMVDRTCAVVVFWTPGFAECFLSIIDSGEIISTKLTGLISEGLKAAGYETYKRACESGLRKSDLADCLDQAVDETEILSGAFKPQQEQPVIYWSNDEVINLNDL